MGAASTNPEQENGMEETDPVKTCLLQMFQSSPKAQDDNQHAEESSFEDVDTKCDAASVTKKVLDIVMVLLQVGTMLVWMCRALVVLKNTTLTVLIPVSLILTSLSWWDNYISGKKVSIKSVNFKIKDFSKILWYPGQAWCPVLWTSTIFP